MDKIELISAGIRSLDATPPSEAILRFRTTLGQDVAVHMRPADLRRLHSLLATVIEQFPLPSSDN